MTNIDRRISRYVCAIVARHTYSSIKKNGGDCRLLPLVSMKKQKREKNRLLHPKKQILLHAFNIKTNLIRE